MRKILKISLLLLLYLPIQAQQIIPVSDIRPGMTGYGVSVFRGDKLEKFNVEVIDILKGALAKQDIILIVCKPSYGSFDLNQTGLISGMSGSPIYIDGKLAGALAYGWGFAKETIAGVTPIEVMLKEIERPVEEKIAFSKFSRGVGGLVPLKSPLMVSGATPRSFDRLEKFLGRRGFLPLQGGSLGNKKKSTQRLLPGSAVGAQLMSGDLDITAIGTVTWVEGDKVLAFGHPFFNVGEFYVPITTAHIAMIMKSSALSFKMGYPVKQVGSLVQDRTSCIYGRMGKIPSMLPIRVRVENKITGTSETFHVKVARHAFLTPQLCSIAVYNFLDTQEATWGPNTTWINTKIYLTGRDDPIEISNMYTSQFFYASTGLDVLPYLYRNPFQAPNLKRMEITVSLAHKLEQAEIVGLSADKVTVHPGEKLSLGVSVKPYRRNRQTVKMNLVVPASLPPGDHTIVVMGGATIRPDMPIPEDMEGYLKLLSKLNEMKNNAIIATIPALQLKVVYRQHEMSDLPATVVGSLLPSNHTGDLQLAVENVIATKTTPYVVSWATRLVIRVVENKN